VLNHVLKATGFCLVADLFLDNGALYEITVACLYIHLLAEWWHLCAIVLKRDRLWVALGVATQATGGHGRTLTMIAAPPALLQHAQLD
jgi:hypothetical protein